MIVTVVVVVVGCTFGGRKTRSHQVGVDHSEFHIELFNILLVIGNPASGQYTQSGGGKGGSNVNTTRNIIRVPSVYHYYCFNKKKKMSNSNMIARSMTRSRVVVVLTRPVTTAIRQPRTYPNPSSPPPESSSRGACPAAPAALSMDGRRFLVSRLRSLS